MLGNIGINEVPSPLIMNRTLIEELTPYWEKVAESFPQITQEMKNQLKVMTSGQIEFIFGVLLALGVEVSFFVTQLKKVIHV